MSKPTHHIAVSLVHRQGRWLVAKRLAGVHLGGLWEFPGGKCGAGELAAEAALRELRAECGVRATVERGLMPVRQDYGDRIVHITPVVCRWEAGEPRAIASLQCAWVSAAELTTLEMPVVSAQILRELGGQ